ncbi:hypothetical protein [Paraoerskovia marina]|uniref:hypothetical protein n=1 Tax=Paraoerskovia marina TaxID=545619 RepID=UPI000492A42C|nr:hypothetical protein [Paraoerskovia marina]
MTSRRPVLLSFTLALAGATALTGCSADAVAGPDCGPEAVFATAEAPEDAVDQSADAAGEIRASRLIHEQDGFDVFLVEGSDDDAGPCIWVEDEGAWLYAGCSAPGVSLGGGAGQPTVYYDATGNVAETASSTSTVVNDCLAVTTR